MLRHRIVVVGGDGAANGVPAHLKLEYHYAERITIDTQREGLGVGDDLGALKGRKGLRPCGAATKNPCEQDE